MDTKDDAMAILDTLMYFMATEPNIPDNVKRGIQINLQLVVDFLAKL